ncbi:MAG TPA: discoidin domain-containing protein [Polyangiaceae bacterium]|nr:discoidin domain-containing protein [Polyangiaceae bacterium]
MVDSEREQDAGAAVGEGTASTSEPAATAAPEAAAAPADAKPAEGAAPEVETAGDAAAPPAPAAAPAGDAGAPPAGDAAAPPAPAAAAAAPAGPGFGARLRQFFWMDARLEAAKREGFAPDTPGYPEFELAREGVVCAQRLGELADTKAGVLLLRRESVELLVAAQAARAGLTSEATPSARWSALLGHPVGRAAVEGISADDRALLDDAFAPDAAVRIAGLPKDRRASLGNALGLVTERLAEQLEREAQRVASILYQRWLRIAAAVVVLLAIVAGLVMLVRSARPPENLARGKPVKVSSSNAKHGCDPQQVVDGNRGGLGFHTNSEREPWVEVDLGSAKWVKKVVVYNRETNPARAVPLTLELATEPGQFQEVARRSEVFDVWTAEVPAQQARFVRLKLQKKEFFHLAEIEVY